MTKDWDNERTILCIFISKIEQKAPETMLEINRLWNGYLIYGWKYLERRPKDDLEVKFVCEFLRQLGARVKDPKMRRRVEEYLAISICEREIAYLQARRMRRAAAS